MPKFDPRLIGTWKSDRRKTFQNFTPLPTASPESIRRLKKLFGHMTITWGRTKAEIRLHNDRWIEPYELIARDDDSVVIRIRDVITEKPRLVQIHFEGESHYWLWTALGGNLHEYFRRIEKRR